MTALILYVLLWLWDNRNFDSITKANEQKLGAEKAYDQKRYSDAANLYHQITYGSIFADPAVRLNMAHSYFEARQFKLALQHYKLLEKVSDKTIASIANCQIALIQVIDKDTGAALGSLKIALRLEPGNDLARTNYIILRKTYSGIENSSEPFSNTKQNDNRIAQNQKIQNPTEQKPKEQEIEENRRKEQLLQSLKAMNMTEDQARSILDAMKSNESQYIYQLRRKQYAGKPEPNEQIEW